mmetsp:Transcript_41461/g.74524  ORF Transcript_41461/g.74524 Transcript_41461/m.74524 type:complete len:138 (-) Transcript_41461:171-584(-)|eukprot:CAMPEP_0177759548 /NCGR_PEP_ID=MMETSP0491_2-20121128/4792_1 /TAXON_ID=63592 /ORGANISM="Tetraselmis chuii, Strain PLY429" /LENGTH=137 /DNA_ID=CAMNT_0019275387 /DNA_START=1 /DNA_END=414 /DNA_ORIENTATION=-
MAYLRICATAGRAALTVAPRPLPRTLSGTSWRREQLRGAAKTHLTKKDFIAQVAETADVDVKTADKVVEAFVKTVMKNVVKGEKISFPGFGSFDSKLRAARVARNPKTGEAINVPEKRAPSFTMSKNFKADVADTPL